VAPPDPVQEDVGSWDEARRAAFGIRPLAPTHAEQQANLISSDLVRDVLGPEPLGAFAACRDSDAAGLARGVETATSGRIVAVPAAGPDWTVEAVRRVLAGVRDAPYPVGVVANVRSGPLVGAADGAVTWDVGHFVVRWGLDEEGDRVAVADTYRELGARGGPPGCRLVATATAALVAGIAAPPGRGLLLLAGAADRDATERLVAGVGLGSEPGST
jgi:hypothetical protein